MTSTVVFDTNTLISAALLPGSVPRKALDKAYQDYNLVCSEACFNELAVILPKPKFRKYLSEGEANLFLTSFSTAISWVTVTCVITDCRDAKDNKFLELGISAKATYLVTGDEDLLVLHPYGNLGILTPAAFLAL